MKVVFNLYLALAVFSLFVFNINLVNSSFVCGFVNDSNKISADWANVKVYYAENISDFTNCQTSPENKFCCDLENISSVQFSTGKKVFAEVYDLKRGLVAEPVSLYLTDEGYNIFPDMKIKKAFSLNIKNKNLVLDSSSIPVTFSSYKNLDNLYYNINSSERQFNNTLCENCNFSIFSIPLSKGKNELILSSGYSEESEELYERINIYNLDYLDIGVNVFCDKCKAKKNFLYIPSNQEVTINYYFNSSHNISGEFLFYLPRDWTLINSSDSSDFSLTHKGVIKRVEDQSFLSFNYTIKSPKKIIKQDYLVYQKINGYSDSTKVRAFRLKFLPFHKINPFQEDFPDNVLEQSSSESNPIILESENQYLETVAIFSKNEFTSSRSYIESKENKREKDKEIEFNILTTLPKKEIEKIFLMFKVEKDKSLEIVYMGEPLLLKLHKEDPNYNYYSVYLSENAPFTARIQ